MAKESHLYALACSSCEATKPDEDVMWSIEYIKTNPYKYRDVGYLTGVELAEHQDKLHITSSSTTCPPCAAEVMYSIDKIPEPTVPVYRAFLQQRLQENPEDPYNITAVVIHGIDLFTKYLAKKV